MLKDHSLISNSGRRNFIKNISLTTLGFMVFSRCKMNDLKDSTCHSALNLSPDPEGYLSLPEGFTYKIISQSGDKMDDGFFVPGRPDGMGTFEGLSPNEVIIVRNHENDPSPISRGPFGTFNRLLGRLEPNQLYDAGGMSNPGLGGTTTLVYNEKTQQVTKQHLSLIGTYQNCAGGVTPWGTWLTCEEDVTKVGEEAEKDHGFVFEVSAYSDTITDPKPITDMGRFRHEAVAVDPKTSIVYLTEDRPDSLIYRFIPNIKEQLHRGGKLQVLAIKGKKSLDTRNWDVQTMKVGGQEQVEWLDIDNVLAPEDDLRYRGFNKGAACFARGEGIWFGVDELYFTCTNGGKGQGGQIFKYNLSPDEGSETENSTPGILELFIESNDRGVLNMCDNLTITPSGDLLVCEDNGERNKILRIKKDGEIVVFGCNESSDSEFAGIVFSPSGKTLFVNLQQNDDTIAITGPWENIL